MADSKKPTYQDVLATAVRLEKSVRIDDTSSGEAASERQARTSLRQLIDRQLRRRAVPAIPDVSIIIPVFNKVALTLACLQRLSEHESRYSFEVIVIDNASSDATAETVSRIEGVTYVRNETNRGFVDGCNQGAKLAQGETLVFLNNDTLVLGQWLNALVGTLEDPTIGLAGSKLIYPDGRLQDAGGIIFSDGSGHNYGKGQDTDDYHYNYVRDVDYCTGASMAIDRAYFIKLDMFDRRYAPAYYEDADLAMRVHQSGKRVVFQPASVVVHVEGGTSGTDIKTGFKRYQLINQAKFVKRWKRQLSKNHHPAGTRPLVACRYGKRPQVLIIDSIVPEYDRDAGSLRMWNIVRLIRKLGYAVTVFPDNRVASLPYTQQLQAQGVEVVYGNFSLRGFYEERSELYGNVIISRPLSAVWHLDICRAHMPGARIIYDTVDLHYLRVSRQAEVEKNRELVKRAADWKKVEYYLMDHADMTLVVSHDEQKLLKTDKPDVQVKVVSMINQPPVSDAPLGFSGREGLLFIGSSHPPNEDAITWFARSILPAALKKIPELSLNLLGSNPSDAIKKLASSKISVPGFINDIDPYFQEARIFVCPMRFGAGVKGKLSQALAHGLPIISTSIGIEGMRLRDGYDCLVADTAEAFARQLTRLYQDEKLWQTLHKNALKTFEENFSENAGLRALRDVLEAT